MALTREDAQRVDAGVQDWAATGAGFVLPSNGGAFFLFVSGFAVKFYWDDVDANSHLHVEDDDDSDGGPDAA